MSAKLTARLVLGFALVLGACARTSLELDASDPSPPTPIQDAAVGDRDDGGGGGTGASPPPDAAPPPQAACGQGATRCAAACVDTRWDPQHCGGCDRACASGQRCDDGVCAGCREDEVSCADRCIDPRTDARHCGATLGCSVQAGSSGTACAAEEACVDARCVDCPLFVGPRTMETDRVLDAVRDFDGDGIGDLWLAEPYAIVYSDGAPLSRHSKTVPLQLSLDARAWPGDLDGDGDLDVVWAEGGVIGVFLLQGAGEVREVPQPETIVDGHIVLGAWDGDEALDLLRIDVLDGTLQLYLGQGDGTFAAPQLLGALGPTSQSPEAHDVDSDGRLDLVLHRQMEMVVHKRGAGSLSGFQGGVASVVSQADFWRGTFADIDGDGLLDAIMDPGAVFLGTGSGAFLEAATALPVSWKHVVADLDADGDPDLAFFTGRALEVWLNDGRGELAPFAAYTTLSWYLFASDMNGDGQVDLVAHGNHAYAPQLTLVFDGHGDGTFDGFAYHASSERGWLVADDFDGDGNLDLYRMIETDYGNDGAFVEDYERLMGDGAGGFVSRGTSSLPNPRHSDPRWSADLNGDGRADLITAIDNYDRDRTDVGVFLAGRDGALARMDRFANLSENVHGYVQLVDIDGDGVIDVAPTGSAARFMFGRGDGRFGDAIMGEDHALRREQLVSDLSGDGRADLLQLPPNELRFARGLGDGSFGPDVHLAALDEVVPAGAFIAGHAIADANADRLPDLVLLEVLDGLATITTAYGRGDATWSAPVRETLEGYAGVNDLRLSAVQADLDGDGLADLLLDRFSSSYPAFGLIADGRGHYRERVDIIGCALPLAHSDVDGDGVRDLICSAGIPTSFMIARGNDRSACAP